MQLATYEGLDGVRVGVVDGDQIWDLAAAAEASGLVDTADVTDMRALLETGEAGLDVYVPLRCGQRTTTGRT